MSGTHLALSYGNTSEITLRKNSPLRVRIFPFKRYNRDMDSRKFLIRLLLLIFFIFLLNYLAMNFYWYSSIWYFDMLMHFLGGFWLGLTFIWFFKIEKISSKTIFKIILEVLLISILWEVFEVVLDKNITGNIFNVLDTVSDILFDIAGGFFAILYFLKKIMSIKKNRV